MFLNDLTIESIDRAILAFSEGIKLNTALPDQFNPRQAQLACYRVLRLTEKTSIALNNVYDIPMFWINIDGLMHSSNISIVESRITRAYCMQGALNFHIWLIDIVQHAIESSSCRTWIKKLASDVWMAVNQKRTVVFDSIEYLPKLKLHKTCGSGPLQCMAVTSLNLFSSMLYIYVN